MAGWAGAAHFNPLTKTCGAAATSDAAWRRATNMSSESNTVVT
jgi:hypothetical protein